VTAVLSKPSDVQAPVREAGGDKEVPRDKLGRPRIRQVCSACVAGKLPSPKTGKPIQCSKCKGTGEIERSYTRTTTYIDVLDDKSNLQAWGERMVLVGVEKDRSLLDEVPVLFEVATSVPIDCTHKVAERKLMESGDCESCDARAAKDELNRRAQVAKIKAGSEEKADKGTELHGLSELVDQGLPLPKGIAFGDVIDMDAYRRSTRWLNIVHMEKLVVCDELKVGGTPDRVSHINVEVISKMLENYEGELFRVEGGKIYLVAPDGSLIGEDDLLITDLKTGTVQYGALKMAMQLAIYSRSLLYDHKTGERSSMGNVNQDWGIIMNVPAGSGEAKLYWADLSLGWRAVEVAGLVRELRTVSGSNALLPLNVAY
jgi:hypothetical protein